MGVALEGRPDRLEGERRGRARSRAQLRQRVAAQVGVGGHRLAARRLHDLEPQRPPAAAEQQRPPLGLHSPGLTPTSTARARRTPAARRRSSPGRRRRAGSGRAPCGPARPPAARGRGGAPPARSSPRRSPPPSSCSTNSSRSSRRRSRARTSSSPPSAASFAESASKSSSAPIATSSRRATGPESRPGGQPHHADAGALVAGHDRPLDRRRAAPARQQRGMDVEHRPLGEQRLADQLAEGADDDRLGPGGANPLQRRLLVDVRGLQQVDLQLARRPRRPAAACAAAAPLGPVGRGDDQQRPVRGLGQAAQHGGGELRCAEVDGPHASVRGSRCSPSSPASCSSSGGL